MRDQQQIYVNLSVVIFTIIDGELHVLLVERSQEPFLDWRCLPGGYMEDWASAEKTIMKKLFVKVWLKNIYLEQYHTFTDPKRDPRYRAINISYFSIGTYTDIKKYSPYGKVDFHPLKKLPKLAFDHQEIIRHAYRVLRERLFHSNIAQFFLPKQFTFKQLKEVYDAILQTSSDVRNFRHHISTQNIIKNTWKKEQNVAHRPADLYEFIDKTIKVEEYSI